MHHANSSSSIPRTSLIESIEWNTWYNLPALQVKRRGRVVWLSAHAWKACNPQRFAGSNPALSANEKTRDMLGSFFCLFC